MKRKLEIGWARQSDKDLYEKLWKETKEKQEQELRERWAQEYATRVLDPVKAKEYASRVQFKLPRIS